MMNLAVEIARDIIQMQERIYELEDEVARLRPFETKYHELIGDSIKHSEVMMGYFLRGVIDGRFD